MSFFVRIESSGFFSLTKVFVLADKMDALQEFYAISIISTVSIGAEVSLVTPNPNQLLLGDVVVISDDCPLLPIVQTKRSRD